MKQPIVITTAITGSQPRKKDNPALPVTPSEQIESTHEAFEAGSSLVHIHVRDKDENSSSDPDFFGQVQEGVRKHCPGMIIQFSTGGRGREADQRGAVPHLNFHFRRDGYGRTGFDNDLQFVIGQIVAVNHVVTVIE